MKILQIHYEIKVIQEQPLLFFKIHEISFFDVADKTLFDPPIPVTFIRVRKGHIAQDQQGYTYNRSSERHWRCSAKQTQHRCKCSVKIADGGIIQQTYMHTHDPKYLM